MLNKSKIFSRFVKIKNISEKDSQQMFAVFEKYYAGTSFDTFENDLKKKTGAIVLRRRDNKSIVGFSTVTEYYFIMENGKPACGVFSGDTIIQKEYWGTSVLKTRFFMYLLAKKIASGRMPIYWLLISKGFKTYLLLANGFLEYYPHPKGKHTHLGAVVKSYCENLFPGMYNEKSGLLDFGDDYQMLKGGVAEITNELRETKPKIAFFEEKNPTWQKGTELPCVGVISYKALLNYVSLLLGKVWRNIKDNRVTLRITLSKTVKS